MTGARLLFEGLEDRILLAVDPAALAAAGLVETVTYTVAVTGEEPHSLAPGVDFAGTMSLPKFQQAPNRILVSAALDMTVSTDAGTREFDSTLGSAQDIQITHVIEVVGETYFGPVSTILPAVPPASALSSAVSVNADSGTVTVQANEDGDTGAPLFVPISDFVFGESDFYQLQIPADNDAQAVGYVYGQAGLQDFIATPSNDELGIGYRGVPDGVKTGVGGTRFNPEPYYNVTVTVVYEYVRVPPPEIRYGGLPEYEPDQPRVFQPVFSGTGEPGAMISVDLYDARNDLIGSTTVPVDAGGNWMASFPSTNVDLMPNSLVLRQTFPNHNALADAGYNLRPYFSPAVMGGMYMSEYLTVENVLGNRSVEVSMDSLFSASVNPVVMGWHMFSHEFLTNTAVASGI